MATFGKNSTSEELGRLKNEKWKKNSYLKTFGSENGDHTRIEKIMGNNPRNKGPNLPAQVNWTQAKEFCKLMNKIYAAIGLIWRLPTEAEWEYSAKAGSTGPFYDTNYSEIPNNEKVYEQHLNKFDGTTKIQKGRFSQLPKITKLMGTFDMHGNVWEWYG